MEASLHVYPQPYAGIAQGRLDEISLSLQKQMEGQRYRQYFYRTRHVCGLVSVNSP